MKSLKVIFTGAAILMLLSACSAKDNAKSQESSTDQQAVSLAKMDNNAEYSTKEDVQDYAVIVNTTVNSINVASTTLVDTATKYEKGEISSSQVLGAVEKYRDFWNQTQTVFDDIDVPRLKDETLNQNVDDIHTGLQYAITLQFKSIDTLEEGAEQDNPYLSDSVVEDNEESAHAIEGILEPFRELVAWVKG